MRTNAPRMVTVILALVLLAFGLALTIFDVSSVTSTVSDLVKDYGFASGKKALAEKVEQVGWASLLLSNLLLVVGSIFKGV